MAAPVVAGTVALMLQANPALTPNLVKAVLQYTSQVYPRYNALTEGAGFLNTEGSGHAGALLQDGAPRLPVSDLGGVEPEIIWGNHRVSKGVLKPNAPAWKLGVRWGAAKGITGQNIVWGTYCDDACDNVVWGTHDSDDNVVWGTASDNDDNIVWGTYADDGGDNIVWGTAADDETTSCGARTATAPTATTWSGGRPRTTTTTSCGARRATKDNIVWGTRQRGHKVWGTSSDEDSKMWGSSGEDTPLFDDPTASPVNFDGAVWEDLFGPAVARSGGARAPPAAISLVSPVALWV